MKQRVSIDEARIEREGDQFDWPGYCPIATFMREAGWYAPTVHYDKVTAYRGGLEYVARVPPNAQAWQEAAPKAWASTGEHGLVPIEFTLEFERVR